MPVGRHADGLRLCQGLAGATGPAAGRLWGFCGDLKIEAGAYVIFLPRFLLSAARRADANDLEGWSGAGSNPRPSAFPSYGGTQSRIRLEAPGHER